MRNIAILGGTFNPIHWGHLRIAETACSQVSLDQIIWVPTHHPPHKQHALVGFEHRLEMVRLAIATYPNFVVSDVEAQRSHQSFAIDTFTDLAIGTTGINWHWIIGLDAFQTLPHWKGVATLAAVCVWLVAPRKAAALTQEQPNLQSSSPPLYTDICQQVTDTLATRSIPLRWHLLPMSPVAISSSIVRQRCQQQQDLSLLVPEMVEQYITKHKLYAK